MVRKHIQQFTRTMKHFEKLVSKATSNFIVDEQTGRTRNNKTTQHHLKKARCSRFRRRSAVTYQVKVVERRTGSRTTYMASICFSLFLLPLPVVENERQAERKRGEKNNSVANVVRTMLNGRRGWFNIFLIFSGTEKSAKTWYSSSVCISTVCLPCTCRV